jgi:hypothetical protein
MREFVGENALEFVDGEKLEQAPVEDDRTPSGTTDRQRVRRAQVSNQKRGSSSLHRPDEAVQPAVQLRGAVPGQFPGLQAGNKSDRSGAVAEVRGADHTADEREARGEQPRRVGHQPPDDRKARERDGCVDSKHHKTDQSAEEA